MLYLLILIAGVFIGFTTSVIPGLLNMNVVKINDRRGALAARSFIFGAVIIIGIQVFIAGYIVHKVGFTDELVAILRKVGFVIFVLMTLYFFFFANEFEKKRKRKKERASEAKRNNFKTGMLLAVANLLPIPFYLLVFTVIKLYKPNFTIIDAGALAIGVVVGTSITFFLYIKFFNRYAERLPVLLKNINYIIGSITSLLALVVLYKIIWG